MSFSKEKEVKPEPKNLKLRNIILRSWYLRPTYPNFKKIRPVDLEIFRANISKFYENLTCGSWDIHDNISKFYENLIGGSRDNQCWHIQISWKSDQWFWRYSGSTYPNFMKIGPVVLQILRVNISKFYENWTSGSYDIQGQHIQISWKLD